LWVIESVTGGLHCDQAGRRPKPPGDAHEIEAAMHSIKLSAMIVRSVRTANRIPVREPAKNELRPETSSRYSPQVQIHKS
jgi:hypothetical protein